MRPNINFINKQILIPSQFFFKYTKTMNLVGNGGYISFKQAFHCGRMDGCSAWEIKKETLKQKIQKQQGHNRHTSPIEVCLEASPMPINQRLFLQQCLQYVHSALVYIKVPAHNVPHILCSQCTAHHTLIVSLSDVSLFNSKFYQPLNCYYTSQNRINRAAIY